MCWKKKNHLEKNNPKETLWSNINIILPNTWPSWKTWYVELWGFWEESCLHASWLADSFTVQGRMISYHIPTCGAYWSVRSIVMILLLGWRCVKTDRLWNVYFSGLFHAAGRSCYCMFSTSIGIGMYIFLFGCKEIPLSQTHKLQSVFVRICLCACCRCREIEGRGLGCPSNPGFHFLLSFCKR